jgi:hypothetical protein
MDAGGGPVVGSLVLPAADVGTPVALSNADNSGVSGWRWEIIDAPEPSATYNPLPAPTYANTETITPDVKGHTIMVRLTTYVDAGRTQIDDVDQQIIGVRFDPPYDWLIPAAQQSIEANEIRGWAADVNRMLREIQAFMVLGNAASDWKESARVAVDGDALPAHTRVGDVITADANGAFPLPQDGVTMVQDDTLVLYYAGSNVDAGIYTLTDLGSAGSPWTMTRRPDFTAAAAPTAQSRVPIEEGTTYASYTAELLTSDPFTVNVTALLWRLVEAGSGTDPDAIHDNVAGEIAAIAEKTTPVSADLLVIEDSAAANVKKRLRIGNLPSASLANGGILDTAANGNTLVVNTAYIADDVQNVLLPATPAIGSVIEINFARNESNGMVGPTDPPGLHLTAQGGDVFVGAGSDGSSSEVVLLGLGQARLIYVGAGLQAWMVAYAKDWSASPVKRVAKTATASSALAAFTASGTGVEQILTANANGAIGSVGGVSVAVGDLVLIKGDTGVARQYHGLWEVAHAGDGANPWVLHRSGDWSLDGSVNDGCVIFILEGTDAGKIYIWPRNAVGSQVDFVAAGGGTDADAIHDNVAGEIDAVAAKATAVAADLILIEDSAAANAKKKLAVSGLRITESQITDLTHTDAAAIHDNVAGEINAVAEKVTPVAADLILIEDSAAANAKKKVQVGNLPSGGGGSISPAENGFRLTPESGAPVTTFLDNPGLTTIYLSPWKSNRISVYNGASWDTLTSAEISYTLSARTTDLPFDLFAYDSGGGTLALEVQNWASATVRSVALVRQDGVWCKSGVLTRRYLGTCRPRSSTTYDWVTIESGPGGGGAHDPISFDLFNADNRVQFAFLSKDSADHTYSTNTWRQWRADGGFQVDVIAGLAEESIWVSADAVFEGSTTNGRMATALAYDTTSAASRSTASLGDTDLGQVRNNATAHLATVVDLGIHYVAWLQRNIGSGTATWFGGGSADSEGSGFTGVWTC